jgi:hypothetical protein
VPGLVLVPGLALAWTPDQRVQVRDQRPSGGVVGAPWSSAGTFDDRTCACHDREHEARLASILDLHHDPGPSHTDGWTCVDAGPWRPAGRRLQRQRVESPCPEPERTRRADDPRPEYLDVAARMIRPALWRPVRDRFLAEDHLLGCARYELFAARARCGRGVAGTGPTLDHRWSLPGLDRHGAAGRRPGARVARRGEKQAHRNQGAGCRSAPRLAWNPDRPTTRHCLLDYSPARARAARKRAAASAAKAARAGGVAAFEHHTGTAPAERHAPTPAGGWSRQPRHEPGRGALRPGRTASGRKTCPGSSPNAGARPPENASSPGGELWLEEMRPMRCQRGAIATHVAPTGSFRQASSHSIFRFG